MTNLSFCDIIGFGFCRVIYHKGLIKVLKAIISGDKKKTNQMILELIDWNTLGIEVVGITESSDEALELIMKNAPDIVILSARFMNMNMPQIAQRFEGQSAPAYIVISGTRSFDSVYNALKYGVEEYLIGHTDICKLRSALEKICGRRLEDEARAKTEIYERRIFDLTKSIIRKNFMMNLFSEDNSDALETIDSLNSGFLFNFRPGFFEVVIIRPDFKPGTDLDIGMVIKLLEEFGAIVDEQFEKICFEHVWHHRHGEIVCVFNYLGNMMVEYKILFERLSKLMMDRQDGVLTIAVGTRVYEPMNIPASMKAAKTALEYRICLGNDSIIVFDGCSFEPGDISEIITQEHERQIKNCVEALYSKGLSVVIDELFDRIDSLEGNCPSLYYSTGHRVCEIVVESIKASGGLHNNKNAILDESSRIISSSYNPAMLRGSVNAWCVGLLESTYFDRDAQEIRAIRIAKAYICDHYMDQLKLKDVALEVNLNPSYFSTLFKKELGINYNDYLIGRRIEAAKQLLCHTTLSISQITERIGYSDSKYFSRLFVKNVGIRPSEYRRLYS